MTPEAMAYMARERAMMMARADWQAGLINQAALVDQARQYEVYLMGNLVTASPPRLPQAHAEGQSSSTVVPLDRTRSPTFGER